MRSVVSGWTYFWDIFWIIISIIIIVSAWFVLIAYQAILVIVGMISVFAAIFSAGLSLLLVIPLVIFASFGSIAIFSAIIILGYIIPVIRYYKHMYFVTDSRLKALWTSALWPFLFGFRVFKGRLPYEDFNNPSRQMIDADETEKLNGYIEKFGRAKILEKISNLN